MRYEIVTFEDGIKRCEHLFEDVRRETEFLPSHPLDVCREVYSVMDATHGGFGIIALDDSEGVAGFISIFLAKHRLTGELHAIHDVFYVKPAYRKAGVSGRLILLAERQAKQRGAKFIVWASRRNSPLAKTFERRVNESFQFIQFVREL